MRAFFFLSVLFLPSGAGVGRVVLDRPGPGHRRGNDP